MKIKDLPKVERPREKLIKYGPEKLSNSELLAILLRTGIKGVNVVELSNKILKKFNGNSLASIGMKELKDILGLGSTKACEIVACFELGRRLLKGKQTEIILSPSDVWDLLKDIRDNKKEHFVVFYLDSRNQEVQREVISVGTINESLVHPREVFEPAIRHSAVQVIVSHNHPAGDPNPSEEDVIITKRLVEAGKLLGIELFDHVIVTKTDYFSMHQQNLL